MRRKKKAEIRIFRYRLNAVILRSLAEYRPKRKVFSSFASSLQHQVLRRAVKVCTGVRRWLDSAVGPMFRPLENGYIIQLQYFATVLGTFAGLGGISLWALRVAQKKAPVRYGRRRFFSLFQIESGFDGRLVCEGVPAHCKVFRI